MKQVAVARGCGWGWGWGFLVLWVTDARHDESVYMSRYATHMLLLHLELGVELSSLDAKRSAGAW